MHKYIIKRLISLIPVFLGISLLSFFIIHLAPGDPTQLMMNPSMMPADIARIRSNLGLDAPLYVQYVKWFQSMLRLDFGNSFISGRQVIEVIGEKLPVTLLLTGSSFLMTIIISIFLGVVSATNQNTKVDYVVSTLAFSGLSIPTFWLGLMLIMVFSVSLGWLPATGMYNLRLETFSLVDRIRHMILPILCLSAPGIASWTRYIRSSMLEVIREDYICTARAKGLPERVVIYKHALRNAMLPMVTLLGLKIPHLFEGAFITEALFGWPGMGQVGINAVFQRDYPVIMAINTFTALIILVSGLLTDLIYGVVDPRIQYR